MGLSSHTCMALVPGVDATQETGLLSCLQIYSGAVEAEGSEQASAQTVGEGAVSLTHSLLLILAVDLPWESPVAVSSEAQRVRCLNMVCMT